MYSVLYTAWRMHTRETPHGCYYESHSRHTHMCMMQMALPQQTHKCTQVRIHYKADAGLHDRQQSEESLSCKKARKGKHAKDARRRNACKPFYTQ
jgi:hypothetical protein